MKKLVCLLWATLIAAAAAETDINGAFKTDDRGQPIDWKFTTDPKSPGKFEILKGNPNVLKLTGGEKAPVIMHGKKIAVKDGDKIRLSVEVGPGQYALTGIYLHGEKGYITSTYKVTQPPKGGVVSAVLEAKDPSGKQSVTSAVPYLRVHNQLTTEFKNFRFELNPVIVIPPPPPKEKIVVRTFPDGYKDNRTGSVFSNAQSMLQFHIWAAEHQFTAPDAVMTLTLPEGCRITRFSVFRSPRDAKAITARGNEWTIQAGRVPFNDLFVIGKSAWAPSVPLTFSSFVVLIVPDKELPARFDVPWSISGSNFETVRGVMQLTSRSAPKLTGRFKRLLVWSWFTMKREMWDYPSYDRALRVIADAGANGLLEANSGFYFPENIIPTAELEKRYGLTPVQMQCFNAAQRPDADEMRKAGFNVRESDLKLDASGNRTAFNKDKKTRQIYCFTAMAEADSPVRAFMVRFYKPYIARGFQYFFPDYELSPYNGCYCEKCRKNFARFANVDEKEVLKLTPGELVYKYPLRWHSFRSSLLSRVAELLNRETGAKIGWNSYLAYQNVYFPPFKSLGFSPWAEEPRILDKGVAFHNVDALATGLESVMMTDAYLQKAPDGTRLLKKPVITRASSLVWNNWIYLCVFGHFEHRKERNVTGLGIDYRRQLQKLEIAHDCALGVDGVEVDMRPGSADADAVTGITEGLQYALNYEDRIQWRFRKDRASVNLFDCTEGESPFAELGPRGSLGRYIYMNIKKYGPLQAVVHADSDWRMVSIFNWDFYQSKKIRLEIPGVPENLRVNLDVDGKKSTLAKPFDGAVSLEIPAGGYAVALLTPNALYSQSSDPKSYPGGRLVPPLVPAGGKGLYNFINNYNNFMKITSKIHPSAGFKPHDAQAWEKRENDEESK